MNPERVPVRHRGIHYPDYEVDLNGQIYNLNRVKPLRQFAMSTSSHGPKYRCVTLYKDGVMFCKRPVHQIVYESWNGRPSPDMVIDHIDEDKMNNSRDNLQVISNRHNTLRSRKPQIKRRQRGTYWYAFQFIVSNEEKIYKSITGDSEKDVARQYIALYITHDPSALPNLNDFWFNKSETTREQWETNERRLSN